MSQHRPTISVSPNQPEEIKTSYGIMLLQQISGDPVLGSANGVFGYVLPEIAEDIRIAFNGYNDLVKALEQAIHQLDALENAGAHEYAKLPPPSATKARVFMREALTKSKS